MAWDAKLVRRSACITFLTVPLAEPIPCQKGLISGTAGNEGRLLLDRPPLRLKIREVLMKKFGMIREVSLIVPAQLANRLPIDGHSLV